MSRTSRRTSRIVGDMSRTFHNRGQMVKRQHEDLPDGVSELVQRLWRTRKRLGSSDKQLLIEDIKNQVEKEGADSDDLGRLFDTIMEKTTPQYFSLLHKKYMIKALCIPNGQYNIEGQILDRILACVGEPKVYHIDGSRTKQQMLPKSVQLELLEWLLCCLHLFGSSVSSIVYRRFPVLLHLLSYEYCRHHIALLVFVGLLNTEPAFGFTRNKPHPLKRWHIKLVVDLHFRFPLDEHLKLLLCLFNKIDPTLNYKTWTPDGKALQLRVSGSLFHIPDDDFHRSLMSHDSDTHRRTYGYLQQQFAAFNQYCRNRRGTRKLDFEPTTILHDNELTINDVHDITSLVRNFQSIVYPNAWLVLSLKSRPNDSFMATKLRLMYNTLRLLGGDETLQAELLYFMKSNLSNNESDSSLLYDRLNRLFAMSAGMAAPDLVSEFLQDEKQEVSCRVTLLKFETQINISSSGSKLVLLLPRADWRSQSQFTRLVLLWLMELTSFINWWLQDLQDQVYERNEVISLLNKVLSSVFSFLSQNVKFFDISVMVLTIYFLRFIKAMDDGLYNELDDKSVVVPQTLASKILFCKHPVVVSEYCGYLLKLKKRKFSNDEIKVIFTDSLLSTLNYLWRDKALEAEENDRPTTLSLNRSLIDKLGMLPTFGYSNILERSTSGNIFHNPAFAFIACQIVRKLEDTATDVQTRHEGPIKKSSVSQLVADPSIKWLGMSYEELKKKVLAELEENGFNGFCGLLYNSISSLTNRRKSSSQ